MSRDKRKRPAQRAKAKRIKKLAKAHEDCQLNGDIETVPAGPIRNETVNPATQGSQPLPELIGRGIRSGWEPTEEMKIRLTDELFTIAVDEEIEPHVRVAAVRASQQGSQQQWERDNPELAGKVKGGGTKVNINNEQQVILTPQAILQTVLGSVDSPTKMAQDLAELEGTVKPDDTPAPSTDAT